MKYGKRKQKICSLKTIKIVFDLKKKKHTITIRQTSKKDLWLIRNEEN